MSAKSSKFKPMSLTTEEQLQDLLLKHEALEQEVNVFVLENREYKKDIQELKERNTQLIEDIATYQQLLQFEQQEITFTHERLSTLENVDLDNIDLNQQIKEYKQLLKQLKLENISIKNENKKYKLALENYDQQKQKREEIYINTKLNLENKIKELQEENESLRIDISTMNINPYQYLVTHSLKSTATHSPRKYNNNVVQHDQSEEKQYEERHHNHHSHHLNHHNGPITPSSDNNNIPSTPYGIMRIKHLMSPGPTPGPNPFPGSTPGPNHRPLTDRSSADNNDHCVVYNEYSHSQKSHNGYQYDPEFDEEGIADDEYQYGAYKDGESEDLSRKSMSNLVASIKGHSCDDVLHIKGSLDIKQSVTNEFDTEILLAKIEQVKKLREVNEDYETKIEELEDELKLLKKQNHQLVQRLDGGFRCIGLRWFS